MNNTKAYVMGKLVALIIALWNTTAMAHRAPPVPPAVKASIRMVMEFEGYVAYPEQDRLGNTIGYGTTLVRARKHGWKGGTCSRWLAKRILQKCLMEEYAYVYSRIPTFWEMRTAAQAALLSMSYNTRALIGPKLVRYLGEGDWEKAYHEIVLGHNPRRKYGLVRRRFAEGRVFANAYGVMVLATPTSLRAFRSIKHKHRT